MNSKEPENPFESKPELSSDLNPDSGTGTIGKNMMLIAWIIALGLATWMFGSIEEKQHNPNQAPSSVSKSKTITVELQRNKYGHYVTSGVIDGKNVVFMLDTGATNVVIPGALEKYLQLKRGYPFEVHTANGTARAYSTEIEYLQIGDIVLRDVKASISPSMKGEEILLGMAALKQLEFRQKGDKLTLIQENY